MKSQKIANSFKNAMGTVFLLAGAFFVCSTLFSIRTVFADPVAPVNDMSVRSNAGRAQTTRASGRTNPRANATRTTRTTRTTVARTAVAPNSDANTINYAPARGTVTSRAVTSRATVNRATGAAAVGRANVAGARNVVSRQTAATSRANARNTRTVRARVAANTMGNARVSMGTGGLRGNSGTASSSSLGNKLYTGNYANIIDSTTGLISNEAFNNCMESYYTCMDEICTARNAAQRRCACAGRVKAFAEAEAALETANEELIKVSGELALLIANKGKDVSEAFKLTDAEKVMNCVSWKDMAAKYKADSDSDGNGKDDATEWCQAHGYYDPSECSDKTQPKYCSSNGNSFGFDISELDGSGSDILASLQAWADAKENTITILTEDNTSLTDAFDNLSAVVNGLAGFGGSLSNSDDLKDSLAETWGYELFEYAHNNVCSRVLDSCFNGIYEGCGMPPSGGRKCGNGAAQCPFNYNSVISVNNTGTYELNFVSPNTGYTSSNSATCFGYTTANGDPYAELRGPVADARRSIMQKYALDANADCDVYGEQLRTTAQNIGYQKVAAQQALQQKRLEFAQAETESILTAAINAGTNFDECISEIYDCYETQASSNPSWTNARIKTYCSQIANVPHCYDEMICNPSTSQFRAVIAEADSDKCNNTQDYTTNTCRNVVTLNEILNGTGATEEQIEKVNLRESTISAAIREKCLRDAGVETVRTWLEDNRNTQN